MEELSKMSHLNHLVIKVHNTREDMRRLDIIFSELSNLKSVSVGWVLDLWTRTPTVFNSPFLPSFLPSLLSNNPSLEEVEVELVRPNTFMSKRFGDNILPSCITGMFEIRGVRLVQPKEHLLA